MAANVTSGVRQAVRTAINAITRTYQTIKALILTKWNKNMVKLSLGRRVDDPRIHVHCYELTAKIEGNTLSCVYT